MRKTFKVTHPDGLVGMNKQPGDTFEAEETDQDISLLKSLGHIEEAQASGSVEPPKPPATPTAPTSEPLPLQDATVAKPAHDYETSDMRPKPRGTTRRPR